jgi:hypothetical protein
MAQSKELLTKMSQLQSEFSQFEQADTKEQCQEAIQQHSSTKQRIISSLNTEPLVNEARNLLKALSGNMQQLESLMAAGARDSGYSGSSEPASSLSLSTHQFDSFNESARIKECMDQLRHGKQMVQNLWHQKKLKLEQAHQLRLYEFDCNQMLEWLQYNNSCLLANYTDIGQSHANAIELLNRHEQFQKNCLVIIF